MKIVLFTNSVSNSISPLKNKNSNFLQLFPDEDILNAKLFLN